MFMRCSSLVNRDEIYDYYSIYTMTTSPYLYITTMYSYWRTSPSLHKLYNIQLQHFRAKFFYKVKQRKVMSSCGKCPQLDLLMAPINAIPHRPTGVENKQPTHDVDRTPVTSWHRCKSNINALQLLRTCPALL